MRLIRQFQIALAFLTRLPAGRVDCTAQDIGRSARWFPLVGALLGVIYAAVAAALTPLCPPLVTAVLIVLLDALLTGAMHFDGLADTADGFGGGRTSDDVLRIMRDHAIGSYGACALTLAIALKVAAIGALIGTPAAIPALLLAPAQGRWSAVFSSALAAYARPATDETSKSAGSPTRFIGYSELVIATAILLPAALSLQPWRGGAAVLFAAVAIGVWTCRCRRKIGGVSGDTLGAGVEISECIVLALFTIKWPA
jgi:cobalamin 5'-phosphate synthase/cobalamin synthase